MKKIISIFIITIIMGCIAVPFFTASATIIPSVTISFTTGAPNMVMSNVDNTVGWVYMSFYYNNKWFGISFYNTNNSIWEWKKGGGWSYWVTGTTYQVTSSNYLYRTYKRVSDGIYYCMSDVGGYSAYITNASYTGGASLSSTAVMVPFSSTKLEFAYLPNSVVTQSYKNNLIEKFIQITNPVNKYTQPILPNGKKYGLQEITPISGYVQSNSNYIKVKSSWIVPFSIKYYDFIDPITAYHINSINLPFPLIYVSGNIAYKETEHLGVCWEYLNLLTGELGTRDTASTINYVYIDSKSGYLELTQYLGIYIPYDKVTKVTFKCSTMQSDINNPTYYAYVDYKALTGFVDVNADNYDDRTGMISTVNVPISSVELSDKTVPIDYGFNIDNPTNWGYSATWDGTTVDGDFFTKGFDFIKACFTIFPPEINALILIAISALVILGTWRIVTG